MSETPAVIEPREQTLTRSVPRISLDYSPSPTKSPTKDHPKTMVQLTSPLSKLRSKAGEIRAVAFDQSYNSIDVGVNGPRAQSSMMGLRKKAATALNSMNVSRETSPVNAPHSQTPTGGFFVRVHPMSAQQSPRAQSAAKEPVKQSFVDRTGISVGDYIKITTGKGLSPFGLDYYTIPTTDQYFPRPKTSKIVNNKNVAFLDKVVKDREWIPAPNKYPIGFDWKNPPELLKKGHFSKMARLTETERILKNPRNKEWPGPASYKPQPSEFDPPKKLNQNKGPEKMCAFISEAQYRGIQTPSPGHFRVSYRSLDPKERAVRIYKALNKGGEERSGKIQITISHYLSLSFQLAAKIDFYGTLKIVKDKTKPSPGDYNVEAAFSKTQTMNIKFKIATGKLSCFIDDYRKAKSHLPGIGAYDVSGKSYDRVVRSPTTMKTLRH